MNTAVYRFGFESAKEMREAELTLHLAIVAAEGLFGESRVRLEVSYHADTPRSAILIDASTTCGDAVVRIYTQLLTREFGADAFRVRRVRVPAPALHRDIMTTPTGAAA